jgi:hypothetical protein
MLESERVPTTDWVRVIRKGLLMLDVTSIKQVRVYGRQLGEKIPDWIQEIRFATPTDLRNSTFKSYSNLGDGENQLLQGGSEIRVGNGSRLGTVNGSRASGVESSDRKTHGNAMIGMTLNLSTN